MFSMVPTYIQWLIRLPSESRLSSRLPSQNHLLSVTDWMWPKTDRHRLSVKKYIRCDPGILPILHCCCRICAWSVVEPSGCGSCWHATVVACRQRSFGRWLPWCPSCSAAGWKFQWFSAWVRLMISNMPWSMQGSKPCDASVESCCDGARSRVQSWLRSKHCGWVATDGVKHYCTYHEKIWKNWPFGVNSTDVNSRFSFLIFFGDLRHTIFSRKSEEKFGNQKPTRLEGHGVKAAWVMEDVRTLNEDSIAWGVGMGFFRMAWKHPTGLILFGEVPEVTRMHGRFVNSQFFTSISVSSFPQKWPFENFGPGSSLCGSFGSRILTGTGAPGHVGCELPLGTTRAVGILHGHGMWGYSIASNDWENQDCILTSLEFAKPHFKQQRLILEASWAEATAK